LGMQRIFAQIFPNLPKNLSCKLCQLFFGVTSKKLSLLIFLQTLGAIFEVKQCWVPFLSRFSGILFEFSGILPKFSKILPKFSTNQIPLYPCLLHHYAQNISVVAFLSKYFRYAVYRWNFVDMIL